MTESITLIFNGTSKTVSNLPDGTGDMIEDAFAVRYRWQPTVRNPEDLDPGAAIPNPTSKSDVVFQAVREFIANTTREETKTIAVAPVLAEVDAQFDEIDSGAIVTETPATTGTA